MFSLICALNGWVNNREAGYLRRHRAHYDVTAMVSLYTICYSLSSRTKIVSKIPYNRYRYNVVHYSTILHTASAAMTEAEDKQETIREFKPLSRLIGGTQNNLAKVAKNVPCIIFNLSWTFSARKSLTPLSIMLAGPTYPVANRLANN